MSFNLFVGFIKKRQLRVLDMEFTFTSSRLPPAELRVPPDPPDKGGDGGNSKIKKATVSFRDKVLGNQVIMEREKVDLIANKKAQVELVQGNRLMPMLHLENSIIEELSIPWRDALVVKLLGKNLGYNTMKTKLENVWKLTGSSELMDVGHAYYMVKFDGEEDKNKVINGGPWMIYDHYLAVCQWSPSFNAATAKIDKTMVWIRIPSLNLVYYDESVLWALASMVGTPVKVDLHTLRVARGRFARICVEVDLTRPVVGRVGINGEWYQVQYEGLHIICTQCGCYGHVLKDCTIKMKNVPTAKTGKSSESHDSGESQTKETVQQQNLEVSVNQVEDEILANQPKEQIPDVLHGEWIKVERRKKSNKNSMTRFGGISKDLKSHNQHSQLDILNMVGNVDMHRHMEKGDVNEASGSHAHDKSVVKKKRVWNDSSGTNNMKTNGNQNNHIPSYGITFGKEKNKPPNKHVWPNKPLVKVGVKPNTNISQEVPVHMMHNKIESHAKKDETQVPIVRALSINSNINNLEKVQENNKEGGSTLDNTGQKNENMRSADESHMMILN
jgi:hypothetical protein